MTRRLASIALMALMLSSAGPAAAGGKPIDSVDAREFRFGAMAIGQAKDVDYARAEGLGLVPTIPMNDHLNEILAKLLAQSPVKNIPARVYIRASGDWAAKTTADANIYVALGVLLRVDNEDEVAALLAHEASHVILGHADADIVQDAQQRAIQVSSLALETRDFVKNVGKQGATNATGRDSAGVTEQSRALLLNTMLLAPAWTRDQERNADLLGTDLLVRAGYSPQGMVTLLEKQKSFETERAADATAQSLDQQLSGFGVDIGATATAEATKQVGGDQALGALAGAAIGKALQWGSKKVDEAKRAHPKTEERIADTQAYIQRYYADSAGKAPQVDPWDDAKDQDATADVLENYIAAIQAKGKLSAGDVAGASKLSKASLTGATRKHAYPNYVDAAVQIAQGGTAPALTDYETALSGPEPAGAIYSEASALYLQTGKQDKAKQVIEAGYSKLQEPPSLTLPLIRTYRMIGRQADADRVAAQCAVRWPKMQAVCSQEAKGQ